MESIIAFDKELFLANIKKYRTFDADIRRPIYSQALNLDSDENTMLLKNIIITSSVMNFSKETVKKNITGEFTQQDS